VPDQVYALQVVVKGNDRAPDLWADITIDKEHYHASFAFRDVHNAVEHGCAANRRER